MALPKVLYIAAMNEGSHADQRLADLRALSLDLIAASSSTWAEDALADAVTAADLVIVATPWPVLIYPYAAWLMGRAWTLDKPIFVRVLHDEDAPRPDLGACTAAVMNDDELLDAVRSVVPHLPEQRVSMDLAVALMRIKAKYRPAPS